jgi:hypothetical protein
VTSVPVGFSLGTLPEVTQVTARLGRASRNNFC